MKISNTALEHFAIAKRVPLTPDEAWKQYAPARTIGATEAHQLAMDEHLKECGFHALISHAIGLGMGMGNIAPQFLGYAYLAGLSQNGLIRAGVSTVADEMIKRWIEVKRGGKDITDANNDGIDDRVQTITTALSDFNIKALFNEAAQKCDFDGGCLIYIDTGDEGDDLKEPLHIDAKLFSGKRIKRFTLVEAINLYPGPYNTTDPLQPDYFKPQTWLVLGREVHASRFLYFAPNQVPVLLRPAYNFFGIPAAQLALDYVAHFTKTREAAQRLLTKFSLTVFKSNVMAAITGAGSPRELDKRMQIVAQFRDNDSILLIDKEQEDVVKLETPISGVTDIVRQSLEFVAAIFRIPFVKFLGISPGGLNATGEVDLTNFYDHIGDKQEKILRRPLEKVLDLLQLHCFGEIDPAITFEFCPLTDEDDAAREATQKSKMERLALASQSGFIFEEEGRQALQEDPDSNLGFIDLRKVPAPEGAGGFGAEEGENQAPFAADSDQGKAITLLERIKNFFREAA